MDHQDRVIPHQRTVAGSPQHGAHRGGHALVDALGRNGGVMDRGVGTHPMKDGAALAVNQNADQGRAHALDVVELAVEAADGLLGDLAEETYGCRLSLAELAHDMRKVASRHSVVLTER